MLRGMGCLFGCASFVLFLLMGLMGLLLLTDIITGQDGGVLLWPGAGGVQMIGWR
jgi:predicted membrane channel-forming protein YqfA (hemolysin III family)